MNRFRCIEWYSFTQIAQTSNVTLHYIALHDRRTEWTGCQFILFYIIISSSDKTIISCHRYSSYTTRHFSSVNNTLNIPKLTTTMCTYNNNNNNSNNNSNSWNRIFKSHDYWWRVILMIIKLLKKNDTRIFHYASEKRRTLHYDKKSGCINQYNSSQSNSFNYF